jgi:PatG Domain
MNEDQISQGAANITGTEILTPIARQQEPSASHVVVPAAQPCPTCSRTATQAVPSSFVHVLGDVDPFYPNPGVEKEAIGAMAQVDTEGLSNEQALLKVLGDTRNGYLVREMCYVLLVQEVPTYILVPRVPQDYLMLVEASRSEMSAVIGTLGGIAGPDVCNGLILPILVCDMIYNFSSAALVEAMPVPNGVEATKFRAQAMDILKQIAPQVGLGTGMQRALTFELLRDNEFYSQIAGALDENYHLVSVEVKPAPLNTPNLADVIIRMQDRRTAAQNNFYVRLDLRNKFVHRVTTFGKYLGE